MPNHSRTEAPATEGPVCQGDLLSASSLNSTDENFGIVRDTNSGFFRLEQNLLWRHEHMQIAIVQQDNPDLHDEVRRVLSLYVGCGVRIQEKSVISAVRPATCNHRTEQWR